MNPILRSLQILLKKFVNNIFSLSFVLLKISTIRIFLILLIFLGILLAFVSKHQKPQKTDATFFSNNINREIYNNKGISKVDDSNKLLKLNLDTYADKRTDSSLKKFISESKIKSKVTGKAANLNNFADKILFSENNNHSLNLPKYNNLGVDNNGIPNVIDPMATGYATPVTYNQPLNIYFPPPIVVVSHTTTASSSPSSVPIPEPSSTILGLMGLSGIWGLRKKL
ncbi:MAG: hypothetical protein A2039_06935 [Candidatus Melainabacteria bacterium GWA2_34_9]|nr:MAG: hypothetical protein A2039_06935 [Candidatus Melainabacteria bacterium GWA2_34_9]